MIERDHPISRRQAIGRAGGFAFCGVVLASHPMGAQPMKPEGPAKAGDFDFLSGEWRINHRRLKTGPSQEWDAFTGTATCWSILDGKGSVEELRIPSRDFFGMGLRLLDVEKQVWVDHWVNAKNGILSVPGQTGVFSNGVGTFIAEDERDGKPIKVRGMWDRITKRSCRWSQAISEDGGITWQENWIMEWRRINSVIYYHV
jgi:hypothetical protein